jgi:hypothetical protein
MCPSFGRRLRGITSSQDVQKEKLIMKFIRTATVTAALLAMGTAVLAADTADHQSHQATATSSPAAPPASADSAATKPGGMQEMHEKMMQGMTPEQRQARMTEHHAATPGMHGDMMAKHQAMEKRMEMMESMMKMMLERMPAPAAK